MSTPKPQIFSLFFHLMEAGTPHATLYCAIPVPEDELFNPDQSRDTFIKCPEGFSFGEWVLTSTRDLQTGVSTTAGGEEVNGPALILCFSKPRARKQPEPKALLEWLQGALPNVWALIRFARDAVKAEQDARDIAFDDRVVEAEVTRMVESMTSECRMTASADPAYRAKLAALHLERDTAALALLKSRTESEAAEAYDPDGQIPLEVRESWRKQIKNMHAFQSETAMSPERLDRLTARIFMETFTKLRDMTQETMPAPNRLF